MQGVNYLLKAIELGDYNKVIILWEEFLLNKDLEILLSKLKELLFLAYENV